MNNAGRLARNGFNETAFNSSLIRRSRPCNLLNYVSLFIVWSRELDVNLCPNTVRSIPPQDGYILNKVIGTRIRVNQHKLANSVFMRFARSAKHRNNFSQHQALLQENIINIFSRTNIIFKYNYKYNQIYYQGRSNVIFNYILTEISIVKKWCFVPRGCQRLVEAKWQIKRNAVRQI